MERDPRIFLEMITYSLLLVAIALLVTSLFHIRRIIQQLPTPYVQRCWNTMAGMIVIFILGYALYARFFAECNDNITDIMVPSIFFLSACFVWGSTFVAVQTTKDLVRIAHLEHETYCDALTGAFNRRGMELHLNKAVSKALRLQSNLSLLMIDLDNFKRVNDEYGHQAGDDVLQVLSQTLKSGLRETDLLARYGGEEFLVIAQEASAQGAISLAERLRNLVETTPFEIWKSDTQRTTIRMTVSIGLSSIAHTSLGESPAKTLTSLMRRADKNLYRAKNSGKNRVFASE